MKYIRKFSTPEDREAYMASTPAPDMPYMHLVESTGEVKFSSPEVDVPLYIKALENLTVKFGNTYEYSKDNVTWTSATSSTSISATKGEMVFFRASGLTASSSSGIGSFSISNGDCNVGGNIMSMVYGADFKGKTEITQTYQFYRLFYINATTLTNNMRIIDASGLALPATAMTDYCYAYMFENQKKLTSSPALPATTLAYRCYARMFYGCTSLVNAPALPATTLTDYCYYYMFYGCTSLVNAPALPATTLASYCYYYMFQDCTSLVNAPALLATTLTDYCYAYMFYGCTSLAKAPALPATTLVGSCYNHMFYGCSGLVNAPTLPATTLATNCYDNMFSNCSSLVNAPALPATTLAFQCYYYMFYGCTSLVNAPELPATTLANSCYYYMFYGCTSLVNAPALPATKLTDSCYNSMFYGCTKLSYIKAMFTTTPSKFYTDNWVNGVSPSGTFVMNIAATWNVTGVHGIPKGWAVENYPTPIECLSLTITADNVSARATTTTIHYTATVLTQDIDGNVGQMTISRDTISDEFPQNTSETETVTREISFTYLGVTATTTITQGAWTNQSYTVGLNNQWQLSSEIANPDSTAYDGVYESFSNKGVDNTAAIMYIDIVGYDTFKLYIRSNAESNYDYVMVSQLDQTINNDTSYSDTTLVKAHTRGSQNSGTDIGSYKLVEFTGIDHEEHRITIAYRKDSSSASGTDRGYVLIPINQ